MVIHGDKGDTEKIYLSPKEGKLEPGKLYTVTVTTTDVGNVSTIKYMTSELRAAKLRCSR